MHDDDDDGDDDDGTSYFNMTCACAIQRVVFIVFLFGYSSCVEIFVSRRYVWRIMLLVRWQS